MMTIRNCYLRYRKRLCFSLWLFLVLPSLPALVTSSQSLLIAAQQQQGLAPKPGDRVRKAKAKAKEKCEADCDKQRKIKPAVLKPPNEPPPPFDYDKCVTDCCSNAYKKIIKDVSHGKWKVKDDADKTHPKYDTIIESILDAYTALLDNGETGLANSDFTYDIKNVKHYGVDGLNRAAENLFNPNDQSTLITNYNPEATSTGWQAPFHDKFYPRLAQLADESVPHQFNDKFFIKLTIEHELGHAKLRYAIFRHPEVALYWQLLWGSALTNPLTQPQQVYFNVAQGTYDRVFEYDATTGFATAMSYHQMGLFFGNYEVWNFVSHFSNYLTE